VSVEQSHILCVCVCVCVCVYSALTSGRRDKETALHKAALYGHLPVVKTLVDAKVDVNAKAK